MRQKKANASSGKYEIVFFILLLVFLLFMSISVYFYNLRPVSIRYLPVKFTVGENYGFDLNSSVLAFGKVVPGGWIARKVNIQNYQSYPVIVNVIIDDKFTEIVSSDSGFIINAGENISIPFSLGVPSSMEYGNYSGFVKIEMFKYRV